MKSKLFLFLCFCLIMATLHASEVKLEQYKIYTDDIELKTLCSEQQNCFNALDDKVLGLGQNLLAVVEKIKQQTPKKFTYGEEAEIQKFKENLRAQVELCHQEKIKLRLAKDALSEATDEDIKEGESGVGTWIGDGAINLFYWYWKSDKGKQEYIRDEIKHEVEKVDVIKDYLSADKIIQIADRISRENLISKDPLKNKFHLIQESYKAFTEEIIKSVLQENCLTDPSLVQDVVGDFKKCVDSSPTQKNIDQCQKKFEQSVGYRVGDKVLDQLIIDNFASQKPRGWSEQKWLALLKKKAKREFDACADSWFLAQNRKDPNDIQVCAYQGVSSAFNETIKYKVDEALLETVPEEKQRARIVKSSLDSFSCKDGDLIKKSSLWGSKEWTHMVTVSPEEFKQGLNECVENLTVLAGQKASTHVMNQHESINAMFKDRPKQKMEFVKNVMDKAYLSCIEQQKKDIKKINDQVEKPKDSCAPAPELAAVNPALCEQSIVMEATTQLVSKGVLENINETVTELYPESQRAAKIKNLSDGVAPILESCKKEATNLVRSNLSQAVDKKRSSEKPKEWEKKYLQCTSGAIGLVAYEVSEPTLMKELKSNEATGKYDLKLADEDIEKFKKDVSQCYSSKVSALDKVDQLSSSLDSIADECAFVGKKSVMPSILPLVLEENFKAYYKDPKRRKVMIDAVMNSPSHDLNFTWRTVFSKAKTNQDVDHFVKLFETRTTAIVFGDLLVENLESFYPTGVKDPKIAEKNAKIHRDLLIKYVGVEFEDHLNSLNKKEAEAYLDQQQFRVAQDIVSIVLKDSLEDNISNKKVTSMLLKRFENTFAKCIEDHRDKKDSHGVKVESSQVISLCTEDIKIAAYKEIGLRVMSEKIKENISIAKYANSTIGHLKKRLNQCLEKARGKKSNNFDNHLDGCLNNNALIISREIGDFTILHYSKALHSQYSKAQMKDYLANMQKYKKGIISKSPSVNKKDPAIYAHNIFNSCVNSIQEDILLKVGYTRARARVVRNDVEAAMTKSDVKIAEVTDKLDHCASKFEGAIVSQLKKRFVNFKYPQKHADHRQDLDKAFDLMMLLRGKPSKSGEASNPDSTWKQLALIGERTVIACNYDKVKCAQYMSKTKKRLERYRKDHPSATDKQLLDQFYNSEYMKFIVRSSVAEQVRMELLNGVSDYKDSDGLLESSIDQITSSTLMEKALRTASGSKVVKRVLEMIKQDKMDDVGSDPVVRENLTKALTKESPRFVDGLMYGLVEPQLRKEKRSPSFKTKLGYFFGIVKKESLDWNKLKETKYGKKARNYFEDKLLIPLFRGEDIPAEEMKKRTDQLTDKVVTAAKKAS